MHDAALQNAAQGYAPSAGCPFEQDRATQDTILSDLAALRDEGFVILTESTFHKTHVGFAEGVLRKPRVYRFSS